MIQSLNTLSIADIQDHAQCAADRGEPELSNPFPADSEKHSQWQAAYQARVAWLHEEVVA